MSHSQVLEWISGSFIQSHWPCPMLWPSSMFSTLLATASDTAPSAQVVLERLLKISSRAAASSARWNRMVRWM